MENSMEKVAAELKIIIDNNGMAYLTEEPYKVYQELLQSKEIDGKTAGLILYALVNNVQNEARQEADFALLPKEIQKRCCLNKKASDYLSEIFLSLYSKENEQIWKEKNLEGLSRFLAEEFVCTWKGSAIWDAGEGTVGCYYQAKITLSPPKEVAAFDNSLSQLLEKNPFMRKEAVHQYYEKNLGQYLDGEFEEYCTCDDYYQPVVEDFEISYYISAWCDKHGFELISCDGDGEDGGYEPKIRSGWY